MKRILFFETKTFTGATRVTRTIAKKLAGRFETRFAIINNIEDASNEIKDAIDRETPDILFSSFVTLNPDVIEIGKVRGLIVIVRNDYGLRYVDLDVKKRILDTYSKADWIIAQTSEMRQEMLTYDDLSTCKIKVVDNPIDKEDILRKAAMPNPFNDNGCFHFLWVGREDPIKDLPTLQKAFEIVHKEHPKTDLTLVSNDSNPYRWMKHADCLVISSISEASPNVLREALFLGIRCVSTDCSSTVRRLLSDDKIAKVSDANSLANVMMNLMLQSE